MRSGKTQTIERAALALSGALLFGLTACERELEILEPPPDLRAASSRPVQDGSASPAPSAPLAPPALEPEDADPLDKLKIVAPPWTLEEIRKAIRPGRRWTLERKQVVWVGPKKEETSEQIQAEVLALEDDGFLIRERWSRPNGEGDELEKKGFYRDLLRPYQGLELAQTEVREEELELGGRRWRALVYVNKRTVEAQAQRLEIWTAKEVPGLALKLSFRSPRLHEDLTLTSFSEGRAP